MGGFKKTSAATLAGGTARSLSGQHFGGAAGQAFGAMRDNQGAQSSYSGGRTYDGAASGGSNIGGNGTPIAGAGGVGANGTPQPKTVPGPVNPDTNNSTQIPSPPGSPICPWQSQMDTAKILIAVAAALLLVCMVLNGAKMPWTMAVVKIIGYAVAAIGLMVIALGGAIAHGPYGQTLQGGILAAAGVGLGIAGAMVAFSSTTDSTEGSKATEAGPSTSVESTDPETGDVTTTTTPGTAAKPAVDPTNAYNNSLGNSGILGASPFVLIGGGMGLVGLAATMMIPPKTFPPSAANDPNWPNSGNLLGYQDQLPSEKALKTMVA